MLQHNGLPEYADPGENAVRAIAAGSDLLLYVLPADPSEFGISVDGLVGVDRRRGRVRATSTERDSTTPSSGCSTLRRALADAIGSSDPGNRSAIHAFACVWPTGRSESTSGEHHTMTSTATTIEIPGYRAGTWKVDTAHSEVGFSIRHLMISKVKGKFERFDATFVTAENPLDSSVTASAEVASITTNEPNRDAHLRTGDFFEAESHPTIDFVSTGVRVEGGDFKVDGDLTIRGITKPVTFDFDFGGFGGDPYGNYKGGATAKTVINREDFGLTLQRGPRDRRHAARRQGDHHPRAAGCARAVVSTLRWNGRCRDAVPPVPRVRRRRRVSRRP